MRPHASCVHIHPYLPLSREDNSSYSIALTMSDLSMLPEHSEASTLNASAFNAAVVDESDDQMRTRTVRGRQFELQAGHGKKCRKSIQKSNLDPNL